MKRFLLIVAAIAFAVPASAQTLSDATLKLTSFATGLNQPTEIRFLGNNDLFVTEKATGRVIRINNGVKTTVLDLNVANNSERGLLGLTLDPNFATNKTVYVYYSASSTASDGSNWLANRLSSFTFNGTSLVNEQILKTFSSSSDGQSSGPNHDGGPIVFGPDGKLYGVTGDLNRSGAEQNNQSAANSSAHVGGIYRLNADGSIPSDNPFAALSNPDFHAWYAYGVRNSFGLTFDPITGNLWDTENGPTSYDEINLVPAGFNSGWTQIMGPLSRSGHTTADLVNLPGSVYSDPEFSFLSTVAPTGLAFLANSTLDSGYRNALLVGDNNNGNLYLFRLNAARNGFVLSGGLSDLVADNTTERNQVRFGQSFGVVTDIEVGADDAVYVTSLTKGTIYRISTAAPEPSSALFLVSLLLSLPVTRIIIRGKRTG